MGLSGRCLAYFLWKFLLSLQLCIRSKFYDRELQRRRCKFYDAAGSLTNFESRHIFCTLKNALARVIRLVEFSPIGRLFTLGSGLKITEVAQIFGPFFPRYQLWIDFEKYIFGLNFGRLRRQQYVLEEEIRQRREGNLLVFFFHLFCFHFVYRKEKMK
jgi:hypothetical protein